MELIFHVFDVHEGVVDGRDFDACFVLDGGSEDESADTTKTIDSNHFRGRYRKRYYRFRIYGGLNRK